MVQFPYNKPLPLELIAEVVKWCYDVGSEATSEFAERLAGYKTSKGAIRLPLGKPIDYELITDIVRWRVKREAKGSDTL